MEIKSIGISEYHVTNRPIVLKTSGLGSCVSIVLYDPLRKIGGMSHFMLPETPPGKENATPERYCDEGIPLFYQDMLNKGASKQHIRAALFGGAEMFPFMRSPLLKIGTRNVEMSIGLLTNLGVPVLFQETGGSKGRTIEFHVETGFLSLHTTYEDNTTYQF